MQGQPKTDYTREELLAVCERAVVQMDRWSNRDSASAHEQLGVAWVMLKAGGEFHVHPAGESGCCTNHRTIWLTVRWRNFDDFEFGTRWSSGERVFYLPTPEQLDQAGGRDWY